MIPQPVPGINLPRLINRFGKSDQKSESDQEGRFWTSAPFIEVELPMLNAHRVIKALMRFVQKDERSVVRTWAVTKFGSIEAAREVLLAGALLQREPEIMRGFLQNIDPWGSLSDEELIRDEKAWRTVKLLAQKNWVDQIAKSIKDSAPKGVDKDTLDRRLRSGLKAFHSAANSGKHTNPQFPYLTSEKPSANFESVVDSVLEFLDLEDKDRYTIAKVDDKKRHRVTALQKELGQAKPRVRLEQERSRWAGHSYLQGTITRKRQASLVWDGHRTENGLALAIPLDGMPKIDVQRYMYQDGTSLLSDRQITSKTKSEGKDCALMPLRFKHAFLRWYTKHVENHVAEAPLERRCIHNTTQFVIVDPEGKHPRLFIRPVFKFYDSNKTIQNSNAPWCKPQCRYLIGIDRGINYVLRAVVVDTEEKAVIDDIPLPGRKREWRAIRQEIAYFQRMRDLSKSAQERNRYVVALAKARRKDRSLGKTETVEAVAKLVQNCSERFGEGNYCFVLENLELGALNLKRNNRVKHLASMEEALIYQMRKRGYFYNSRSNRVDGVRWEAARYTSQVSPFGWWAKRDEVEKAKKQDKSMAIGRKIGEGYEGPQDDEIESHSTIYRQGRWMKLRNEEGKAYGRSRFVVQPEDLDPAQPRRFSWGSELFWDPYQKEFKGKSFSQGVVLDADFVGALNIALRPLVNDGKGKGFTTAMMAEAHVKLNPTFEIRCKIPVYEFIAENDNSRAALRRIVI
ncbi:MAG: hypothetical protein BGO01_19630 [Armatimonadetes bacterium 55-13]|nr:MAG: hypothetical protein BGO01_19630 [Armatimonadetes bacterium 55-13]